MQTQHARQKKLLSLASQKTLLVGIGNMLRGDDGFGPLLMHKLQERSVAPVLDVGAAPENYLGKIIQHEPEVIIFVDAVNFDAPPGSMRLFTADEIPIYGFSTHNMSVRLAMDFIRQHLAVHFYLLGIQPKQTGLGQPMSSVVQHRLEQWVDLLVHIFAVDPVPAVEQKPPDTASPKGVLP